jgi:hypothetical protein
MRKTKALVVAFGLLLTMGFAKAALAQETANVAGAWEMSMEGRRGAMTQTLTIKQDGGKITGTLKGMRGDTNFEGTVEGNKISFTIKQETGRGTFTMNYNGTVSGDEMKGTASMGRGEMNWTAKRQK